MLNHTPYSKRITQLFNISYPILQAPMAGGISTPLLAAAVSNFGALGSLGGGYLKPDALEKQIHELKALTNAPFHVNLFAYPPLQNIHHENLQRASQRLHSVWRDFDISFPEFSEDDWCLPSLTEQIDVIIEQEVPIISFTFGLPSREIIARLQEANIKIIGTATHLLEAILWEELGADAIVAQGFEAGGHRGTFIGDPLAITQTTSSLVQQCLADIDIPVIAAGGIMNSDGIKSIFALNADAVSMGTAFITAFESGAHALYKQRLINSNDLEIVLSKQWTGKWARTIKNQFIKNAEQIEGNTAPFPIQHFLTKAVRQTAFARDNIEYMALWAGSNAYLCEEKPAAELLKQWTAELYF